MPRPSIFIAIKNTTVQKPWLATTKPAGLLSNASVAVLWGLILLHSLCVPLFLLCLTKLAAWLCVCWTVSFSFFGFVYFFKILIFFKASPLLLLLLLLVFFFFCECHSQAWFIFLSTISQLLTAVSSY